MASPNPNPSLSTEAPPTRASEPTSFADFEFYPTVQFNARRKDLAAATLEERKDESGECTVAHFKVSGTRVFIYRSESHPKHEWLVYVDMLGCLAREQVPTQVGARVASYLVDTAVEWTNPTLDGIFAARLKASQADAKAAPAVAAKKTQAQKKKAAKPAGKKFVVRIPRGLPEKGHAPAPAAARKAAPAKKAPASKWPAAKKAAAAKKPAAKQPAAKKAAAKKPAAKKAG